MSKLKIGQIKAAAPKSKEKNGKRRNNTEVTIWKKLMKKLLC